MDAIDYAEFYASRSNGLAVAEVEQNVQPKKRVVVVKVRKHPIERNIGKVEGVGKPSIIEERAKIMAKVDQDLAIAKANRQLVAKYSVDTELQEAHDVELLVRDRKAREAWKLATFGSVDNPIIFDELDDRDLLKLRTF